MDWPHAYLCVMKILPLLLLLLLPAIVSAQLIGDKQSGLASYYSAEYNGAETAYGVTYNKDEMVAAHKAYPFNSTVSVRNEANGSTVVVRIIDKGPFIRGRIIELSERAARELGMLGERTVPVELTLLSTPDQGARGAPAARSNSANAPCSGACRRPTSARAAYPFPQSGRTPSLRTAPRSPRSRTTGGSPHGIGECCGPAGQGG